MAHPGQPWTARPTGHRRWRAVNAALALVALALLVGVGDAVPRFNTAAPGTPPLTGDRTPDGAPGTPEPSTAAPDPPAPTTSPPPPVASPVPTDPPASPTPPRQPTAEVPLRVWIGGDSLWESAGPALADDGRQVLWVGLPVMRGPDFDQRMHHLGEIHAAAATRVDGVDHVPTRRLFSDADGNYIVSLADSDGVMRIMRGADGVHLSTHGAARLAAHLFHIVDDWLP